MLFRKRLDTVVYDPERNCAKPSWGESLKVSVYEVTLLLLHSSRLTWSGRSCPPSLLSFVMSTLSSLISLLHPLPVLGCSLISSFLISLNGSSSSLLTACPYHLSFASLTLFAPTSLHSIMSLTNSPSSVLITWPCHVKLASSSSLQCLPPHIFILRVPTISTLLSFTFSHFGFLHPIISLTNSPSSLWLRIHVMSNLLPHLLCNVYHLKSSDAPQMIHILCS